MDTHVEIAARLGATYGEARALLAQVRTHPWTPAEQRAAATARECLERVLDALDGQPTESLTIDALAAPSGETGTAAP